MAWPRPDGPRAMTRALPSRSTATISGVPQCGNHRRPSCQRGDSTMVSPSSSTRVLMVARVMVISSRPLYERPRARSTPPRKITRRSKVSRVDAAEGAWVSKVVEEMRGLRDKRDYAGARQHRNDEVAKWGQPLSREASERLDVASALANYQDPE